MVNSSISHLLPWFSLNTSLFVGISQLAVSTLQGFYQVTKRLYHPHVRDPKTGAPSWTEVVDEGTSTSTDVSVPENPPELLVNTEIHTMLLGHAGWFQLARTCDDWNSHQTSLMAGSMDSFFVEKTFGISMDFRHIPQDAPKISRKMWKFAGKYSLVTIANWKISPCRIGKIW